MYTIAEMSGDDETTELTSSSQVPEELLLGCSRTGCIEETHRLLNLRLSGNLDLDINCKGEQKSNFGWTSLHLACYFGHVAIAEILINHGADVNLVNDKGDTPLHKAAYTSREDLVVMLLSCNANVFIRNGEGQTARDVSKDSDIKKLLKAAEETDLRKKCDVLLHAAREGDITQIELLLRDDHPPDINCTDSLGNTALHCAAYRGKKEVAVMLLQNGVDSSVRNNRGQLAIDLAISPSMKQILAVPPVKELQKNASRFEGLLLRKSHFLGWKEVWTVVDRGVMSFFASRADATTGTHRKGYKYLDGAEVVLDANDVAVFIVRYSNNTRQRFSVPFVAQQQVDRQRWTNAITEHIEFSTHYLKQGMSEESDADDEIDIMPLGTMQDKLQTAQAHQQLLEKLVDDLKGEYSDLLPNKENKNYTLHHGSPFSTLPHQLALLIESSAKVSSSLSHCLTVFSQQEEVRLLKLRQEQEKCRVLQDALHALAQEHHELEKSFTSPFHSPPHSPLFPDTDCEEFFDAFEGDYSPSQIALLHNDSDTHSSKTAVGSETGYFASFSSPSASLSESTMNLSQSAWGRAFLPVPMFSRNDFSIWSILKQCIGKDLTKITMPVVFNEPLSFLQRMAESMEYYYLLDKADLCEDPLRRMEYVAAFAVASISSNWERLGKPFNPLLGETYELVREDLGFRVVYEQVSHHPPVSAFHSDSAHFIYCGAIHPKLKLWARSAEAKPEGTITLQLRKHNEVYTWSGVTCIIHNIIVGKLWMEQCGTMEITCHSNGLSTTLNFKPAGWFGKDLNCVEGFVSDRKKTRLRFIYGTWCTSLRSTDVDFYETYINLKEQKQSSFGVSESDNTVNELTDSAVKTDALLKSITRKKNGSLDSCPHQGFEVMYKTFDDLPSLLLWQVNPRPDYSPEYYNFTLFAMALNELQDGMESTLPPTDSRLRPDIRKLEHSDLDMAASEKNRLEEKQRKARKIRNKEKSIWEPLWFTFRPHQYVKEDTWTFTGKYWERNFSHSPDIF